MSTAEQRDAWHARIIELQEAGHTFECAKHMTWGIQDGHSYKGGECKCSGSEEVHLNAEVQRLQAALEQEKILRHQAEGHTEHCAKRLVWGDGECECGKPPRTLSEWQKAIHQYAKDKGWWDSPRAIGDIFILFTSEVSEAYEEYRNGRGLTETYYDEAHPGKPEGVPTELADVVIRILDFCEWAGIDLQEIMDLKHRFNLTRPYRHGGKRT